MADRLANSQPTKVSERLASVVTPEAVDPVQTPAVTDVIIDVRHPSEEERARLTLTNNEILKIPFYELNQQVPELPADRQYLLYCDRGTMSRMHAGHLKAEGLNNVKVYAPAG